jgi:hypothetical protein
MPHRTVAWHGGRTRINPTVGADALIGPLPGFGDSADSLSLSSVVHETHENPHQRPFDHGFHGFPKPYLLEVAEETEGINRAVGADTLIGPNHLHPGYLLICAIWPLIIRAVEIVGPLQADLIAPRFRFPLKQPRGRARSRKEADADCVRLLRQVEAAGCRRRSRIHAVI